MNLHFEALLVEALLLDLVAAEWFIIASNCSSDTQAEGSSTRTTSVGGAATESMLAASITELGSTRPASHVAPPGSYSRIEDATLL